MCPWSVISIKKYIYRPYDQEQAEHPGGLPVQVIKAPLPSA